MKTYPIDDTDRQLISLALDVLAKNLDDKLYRHTVGSALRCKNGKVYLGVNCYAIHGSCAEFISIGAAITAGEREFDTIVAVHEHAQNSLLPPCGNCRQMLFEYSPDIKVILNGPSGQPVKADIKDLLPLAYVPPFIED